MPTPADNGKTHEPTEVALGPKVFRITEDQLEKVRDVAAWAKDVETRLSEEQKRASELEEQNSAFRETALSAAARIPQLEIKLAEEQKRSATLSERIAELEQQLEEEQKRSATLLQRTAETEHAASCAQKLAEILEEIGQLAPRRDV